MMQVSKSLTFLSLIIWFAAGHQGDSRWREVGKVQISSQSAPLLNLQSLPKAKDAPCVSVALNDIAFASNRLGIAAGDCGSLAITSDGGSTWAFSSVDEHINFKGLFFLNERSGWVVGNYDRKGIVLKTEEGPRNWTLQSVVTRFDLSGLHDVWFTDGQHGYVVGEMQSNGVIQGIILGTKDGGRSWDVQYAAGKRSSGLYALKFIDSTHGWAVGHNLILTTSDGGMRWDEQFYRAGQYLFGIDFNGDAAGWVVGSDGVVLHTTDQGKTWSEISAALTRRNNWFTDIKFIDTIHGWIASTDGMIIYTRDGGSSWSEEYRNSSALFRKMASTPQGLFVAGDEKIILRRGL